MKCDKCGTDMFWHGSMRDGYMACGYCQLIADFDSLPMPEVQILNAQPVDPAGCHDDFPLAFYAMPVSHDEDETECKRCGHIWTSERVNTFAICPECSSAGRKEYV